mmetsp:Transcript_44084/g.122062  ORF Transcript_44084/g.122062 Transcript_44084/m.122062 type:complete len:209 (-) Transcript_44084:307-933(-)
MARLLSLRAGVAGQRLDCLLALRMKTPSAVRSCCDRLADDDEPVGGRCGCVGNSTTHWRRSVSRSLWVEKAETSARCPARCELSAALQSKDTGRGPNDECRLAAPSRGPLSSEAHGTNTGGSTSGFGAGSVPAGAVQNDDRFPRHSATPPRQAVRSRPKSLGLRDASKPLALLAETIGEPVSGCCSHKGGNDRGLGSRLFGAGGRCRS